MADLSTKASTCLYTTAPSSSAKSAYRLSCKALLRPSATRSSLLAPGQRHSSLSAGVGGHSCSGLVLDVIRDCRSHNTLAARLIVIFNIGTLAISVFIAMNGLKNKTLTTQWVAVAFVFVFQFLMGVGWMACPWLVRMTNFQHCLAILLTTALIVWTRNRAPPIPTSWWCRRRSRSMDLHFHHVSSPVVPPPCSKTDMG